MSSRTAASEGRPDRESAALRFARSSLGPLSHTCIELQARDRLREALGEGLEPEDAVLRTLHGQLGTRPGLEDEFVGYFLGRLLQIRMVDLYPGLRRFLDTGDLVQSVLGDIWPQLRDLKFRDQASFLALLVTRLRWKAGSRRRDLQAGKRQEGRRDDSTPLESLQGRSAGPHTNHVQREDAERAAIALLRLPADDQAIVRLHLRGAPSAELAEALGLTVPAARKRLERALRKLRQVLGTAE